MKHISAPRPTPNIYRPTRSLAPNYEQIEKNWHKFTIRKIKKSTTKTPIQIPRQLFQKHPYARKRKRAKKHTKQTMANFNLRHYP